MKRTYLAFVGSPATYGTPHPVTGRHNAHGKLFFFENKKARDEFCDQYSTEFNSYPKPTNKQEAKASYFGGMTQAHFDEQYQALEAGCIDHM